jgi:threonine/homoserine/homoserine lactone efflux protein
LAPDAGIWPFVLAGIGFGLASGLTPGPTTTLVISQTLRYGAGEGFKIAVSPALTDAPIIAATFLVLRSLAAIDPLLAVVALLGAAFLTYLGVNNLRAKPVETDLDTEPPRSWLKGVLSNALNPHPYVFWLTVGAPMLLRALDESRLAAVLFVAMHYGCMIGSKLLMALLVQRGRSFLRSRAYLTAMRLLGLVLLVFAVLFLWDGLGRLGLR